MRYSICAAGILSLYLTSLSGQAAQVYWTERNQVRRSASNGTSVETLVTLSNSWPNGIVVDSVRRKLYWVNDWGSAVYLQRANLDGTGLENLIDATVGPGLGWGRPQSVAIDETGAASAGIPKLYLGETDTERILRANLDGTGVETVVSGLPNDTYVKGVAVDLSRRRVYWAGCCPDNGPPAIARANLGASAIEEIVLQVDPAGVALDVFGGKVYWGSRDTLAIWRSNLDGTQAESVMMGAGDVSCLAVDRTAGLLYWADPTNLWQMRLDGSGRQLLVAGTNWVRGIAVDSGAPPQAVQLVPFDAVWKYHQNGVDLGTAWKEPGYDDSSWPQGEAMLGVDINPNVDPLIRTPLVLETNGNRTVTYYFRTRFQAGALNPEFLLHLDYLVDDGAVIYLNGSEIQRVNMPSGPVDWQTRAYYAIPTHLEGIILGTNGPSRALVTGENVLAVEVHQANLDSTDIVFGMALYQAPSPPLYFTGQPANTSQDEGGSVTLSASVGGSLPQYQWFKDGAPIAGANQDRYVIPQLSAAHAGHYYLVATNAVDAITSAVATVTMILYQPVELVPPVLLAVQPANDPIGGWIVVFDHTLETSSALDPAHYVITRWDTGAIWPILELVMYGGNSVRLKTSTLLPGINYVLTVNDVRDLNGQTVAVDSRVAFPSALPLFDFAASWRYNDSGSDLGAGWREISFDDSSWPAGLGLLYNDQNFNPPPGTTGATVLNVTNAAGLGIVTHYFRRHFNLSTLPVNAELRLGQVVDDGAIYYLNGLEIARYNMPSGSVSSTTRASASGTEGVIVSRFSDARNLVVGDNVLAVEVHQFSLASPNTPDITFGLEATLLADSFANTPPVVLRHPESVTVMERQPATFYAEVLAATHLQWLRDGEPIPGANQPRLNIGSASGADDGVEFSLFASNRLGFVTSHPGTLRVVLDREPPQLLGANFGTNEDRVAVTFSEVLDPATALDVSRYSIRDELGELLLIHSAALTNGSNVVLTTAPRSVGRHLRLVVDGVTDASLSQNGVWDKIPVGYEVLRLSWDWVWRYDDTGLDLGTAWRESVYEDSSWPQGPGLLGFEDMDTPPAEPIRTMLPPPEFRGPVYYFRTHLQFVPHPEADAVWLRHFVDDGIVLFLNGVEVHRLAVPLDQNYRTLATRNVEPISEGPFELPQKIFIPSGNVLAAEIHQSTLTSADSVFGAQVTEVFDVQPLRPVRPRLHLMRDASQQIQLSWEATDYVLESAPTPVGPWTRVAGPTMPYTLNPTNSAGFYRLAR